MDPKIEKFEPAEGSTKTPCKSKVFLSVRRVGFEPTKAEADRFTVCCDRPLHHRRIVQPYWPNSPHYTQKKLFVSPDTLTCDSDRNPNFKTTKFVYCEGELIILHFLL